MLYFLLLNQLLLSACTLYIYYTGDISFYQEYIGASLSALLNSQSYLEIVSPWLMWLYTCIVLFKSIQLFTSWQRFKTRSRINWVKPSTEMKVFTAVKSYQFGIRSKISLWYSSAITTPLTFGFFRPVILLPVALVNNLSVKETETLIIHELTHIKNNDYILNWLLIICETVYFFNPFMKLLGNQVKLEREKNCDAQVLQFNYPAIGYAETLLKAARLKKSHAPFILAAVLKHTHLLNRIQFFTRQKNLDFYKRNYMALAVVPLLLMLVFNVVLFNSSIENKKINQILPFKEVARLNIIPVHENTGLENSTKISPVVYINEKATEIPDEINKTTEPKLCVSNNKEESLIMDEFPVENFATPVAISESDDTKEVTIKEENSETGLSVTKVYQMKIVKGEWKAKLMWMITDLKPVIDSLHLLLDSTKILYNLQEQ